MPSSEQDLDAAKHALRVELRAPEALSPSTREDAERRLNAALSTWLTGVERLGLYAASGSEALSSALARAWSPGCHLGLAARRGASALLPLC